jgi:hypothetical protein
MERDVGVDWLIAIAEDWERARNGLLNAYCSREFDYDGVNCRYCVFREDTGRMAQLDPTGVDICAVRLLDTKMDKALEERVAAIKRLVNTTF